MTIDASAAVFACEKAIKAHQAENRKANIWPSADVIALNLLKRRDEMREVYEEVNAKLYGDSRNLYMFFELVLTTPVVWSLQSIEAERQARAINSVE